MSLIQTGQDTNDEANFYQYEESDGTWGGDYHSVSDESIDPLILGPRNGVYDDNQLPTWESLAAGHSDNSAWTQSMMQTPCPDMLSQFQRHDPSLPYCGPPSEIPLNVECTEVGEEPSPSSPTHAGVTHGEPLAVTGAEHRHDSSRLRPSAANNQPMRMRQSVKCLDCGKCYTGAYAKGNMGRHWRQKHENGGGTGRISCTKCDKKFERLDALLKHKRKIHPELKIDPAVRRDQRNAP